MYFNYHAKIKNKIKENKLVLVDVVNDYHAIKPAMILYFNDSKPMVVRVYRFKEYFDIFNDTGFTNIKFKIDLDEF